MILISFGLTIFFTILVLATLRLRGKVATLLAGGLIAFSHILLTLLIANSLLALARREIVLLIQILLLDGAWLVWRKCDRPYLLTPFRGWRDALPRLTWSNLFWWLLGGGVAASWLFNLVLIWWVPPNNNDSLSTHLSRIGYWLQNSSFFPWPIFNTKEVFYPINAALQVYWTVLFSGSDRLAGLVQWAGGLATILSVFGLARLLGYGLKASTFAACSWAAFPVVVLQGSTTQLDLIAAGIFLPVLYFLLLGIQTGEKKSLVLSGLSLGLALGTKQTLIFLLPGLFLLLLVFWKFWRNKERLFFAWLSATVVFFLLLSSYIYIINLVEYGTPFGPAEVVNNSTGGKGENLLYNVPRLAYQAVDFSGMPTVAEEIGIRVKAKGVKIFSSLTGFSLESEQALAPGHQFDLLRLPVLSEDESWFGFLSTLLLWPAVVIGMVQGVKRRDSNRFGLILFAFIFLLVNALLRPGWDPFQGRYFIPAVAALAPLMGEWAKFRKAFPVMKWFFLPCLGLSLVWTFLFNPAKPLKSPTFDIWKADRNELQSFQSNDLRKFLYMVNKSLPQDTCIAFYSEEYLWDYPLFGEHFTRRVIPIIEIEQLTDLAWLQAKEIDYVLVREVNGGLPPVHPYLVPADEVKGQWMLYTWTSLMP